MTAKSIDMNYIIELGLHDSELSSIFIDYNLKNIIMNVTTQTENFIIELTGLELLKIEKENDFKNKEIILDFNVNPELKTIEIFTTSNSRYEIKYQGSLVKVKK